MNVSAARLSDLISGLRALDNLKGVIVSMPHKEAVFAYLDGASPEAKWVGACNVIRREPNGRLTGTNLDGLGFVNGLHSAGHETHGKSVFLADADGAAAAIAFALADEPIRGLTICNRNQKNAEALCASLTAANTALQIATATSLTADHQRGTLRDERQ